SSLVPPSTVCTHFTRPVSSSIAFSKGIPISEICRAATWVSAHTFPEHYAILGDSAADAKFGITVPSSITDLTPKPQPSVRGQTDTATKIFQSAAQGCRHTYSGTPIGGHISKNHHYCRSCFLYAQNSTKRSIKERLMKLLPCSAAKTTSPDIQ
ncbi:unnamed protein product, partial [Caretta caretta]